MLALLAYLAVTAQPHSRESLITFFWPESDPSVAFASFRSLLAKLKKTVGEFLEIQRDSLALLPQSLKVDVQHFRTLLSCSLPHPKTEACPRCAPSLTEAAQLYRGDFLAGFTLRNSSPFDDWQRTQTESLRREFIGILQRLISWHTRLGDHETVLAYARRWVALDPLDEAAHRMLIQHFLRTHQNAAAQEQYANCLRLFREEMGTTPSLSLERLAKEFAPDGQNQNLISLPDKPLTPFIGRAAEHAQLLNHLANPACRLVTLVGLGGAGKTRLAYEIVESAASTFSDGVFFISLESTPSPAALPLTLAQAFHLNLDANPSPETQIFTHLQTKNALLILDNFEQLLLSPLSGREARSETLLLALLHAAPHVKLLITSRVRLNLRDEWILELGGLDPRDAIQLFQQRACQTGFALSSADLPLTSQICQHLDGHPLALEMAAGWLSVFSLPKILAELAIGLQWLSSPAQDIPERHKNLVTLFETTWNTLSEVEKETLMVLSVFHGGITLDAAEQVAHASPLRLAILRHKALLESVSLAQFKLHPLIRQFAQEKLAASQELSIEAQTCHSVYFMAFLAAREQALKGANQTQALEEIQLEMSNIQPAWIWAAKHGQLTCSALESLYLYYHIRSHLHEGAYMFCLAVEHSGSNSSPRLRSRLLLRQGKFHLRLGENERAEYLFQESLALAYQANMMLEIGLVLNELGSLALSRQEYVHAETFYQESLLFLTQAQEKNECHRVLNNLGIISKLKGELDIARNFYQQSLEICREIGDQRSLAIRLTNLGNLAFAQKDYATAHQYYEESVVLLRTLSDLSGVAFCLINLGNVVFEWGDTPTAHQYYVDAYALAAETGNHSAIRAAQEGLTKTLVPA
ncbi:MAG: tetratricopeptide repeat protein [Anaerolineales bacterium]|nr:tetratricopeptide repeat protein [Anaerolineales bacterium]